MALAPYTFEVLLLTHPHNLSLIYGTDTHIWF